MAVNAVSPADSAAQTDCETGMRGGKREKIHFQQSRLSSSISMQTAFKPKITSETFAHDPAKVPPTVQLGKSADDPVHYEPISAAIIVSSMRLDEVLPPNPQLHPFMFDEHPFMFFLKKIVF